jgi:hypothetical protein
MRPLRRVLSWLFLGLEDCCGDCGPSIAGQTVPGGMVTEIRQAASACELRFAKLLIYARLAFLGRMDKMCAACGSVRRVEIRTAGL